VKHLNCKLYYQQLHLKYSCNLGRYWIKAPWGWHDSVETCRSVIICEIIVYLLVILQNNKRCAVHSIKINNRALCFWRPGSSSMATSVVWVMNMDVDFINTTIFRCNYIQRVYTRSSYTRKPVFVPLWGNRYSGVTLCIWTHQNSNCHAMWKPRVTNAAGFSYDAVTLRREEYGQLLFISNTVVITCCTTCLNN